MHTYFEKSNKTITVSWQFRLCYPKKNLLCTGSSRLLNKLAMAKTTLDKDIIKSFILNPMRAVTGIQNIQVMKAPMESTINNGFFKEW